jgi:hypothetical protein
MANKKQTNANGNNNHKYRTEIPNLIVDKGLSPYALCLYVHIKRTAGDKGKCWKSIRTLAKDSGMCRNVVFKAEQELMRHGQITISKVVNKHGGYPCNEIRITDVWDENYRSFAGPSNGEDSSSGYRDDTGWTGPTLTLNADGTYTRTWPDGSTDIVNQDAVP